MIETITIVTCATTTDRYGTVVDDWTDTTSVDVTGRFAPGSTSEDRDGRSATVETATVYLPTGTAVTAANRLVIRGRTYLVDGVPADWRGITRGGIAVPVKEVAG